MNPKIQPIRPNIWGDIIIELKKKHPFRAKLTLHVGLGGALALWLMQK